jgi:hypothetical protein
MGSTIIGQTRKNAITYRKYFFRSLYNLSLIICIIEKTIDPKNQIQQIIAKMILIQL